MSQVSQVLLLTREPTVQNLVEQVCHIDGHASAPASSLQDAYALIAQGGQDAFGLAVIDAAALGLGDSQQQLAHQLWLDWRTAYPGLPVMIVGAQPPNEAVAANRADGGGFLEKPFGPYQLADMMRTFLPGP